MTIEIKQLVIRATVQQGHPRAPAAAPAPGPVPAPPVVAPDVALGPDLEALVTACTRQVLRELRKRGGR